MLVGPSKCLKQIIQIELNRVKNPNWPEANQVAIYKRGRGIWTLDYREQIQLALRAGLVGASEVRRSNCSATLPRTQLDKELFIWKINYSLKRCQMLYCCSFRLYRNEPLPVSVLSRELVMWIQVNSLIVLCRCERAWLTAVMSVSPQN